MWTTFRFSTSRENLTKHYQACHGNFYRSDDVLSKVIPNPEHEHFRLAAGFDLKLNELDRPDILDDSGLLSMMLCDGLVLQRI